MSLFNSMVGLVVVTSKLVVQQVVETSTTVGNKMSDGASWTEGKLVEMTKTIESKLDKKEVNEIK